MSNAERSFLTLRSSPLSERSRRKFVLTLRLQLARRAVGCLESAQAGRSNAASATPRVTLSGKSEACAGNPFAIRQLPLRRDLQVVTSRIAAADRQYDFRLSCLGASRRVALYSP